MPWNICYLISTTTPGVSSLRVRIIRRPSMIPRVQDRYIQYFTETALVVETGLAFAEKIVEKIAINFAENRAPKKFSLSMTT